MSEGQAERGRTFYIFNVVQPTVAADIFSNGVPSIALRNRRDFYIVKNVEVSDGVLLEVMYFADGNPNVVYLGSLTTNISVIGKLKHTERGSCTVVSPGWMLATYVYWTRLVGMIKYRDASLSAYSTLCSWTHGNHSPIVAWAVCMHFTSHSCLGRGVQLPVCASVLPLLICASLPSAQTLLL